LSLYISCEAYILFYEKREREHLKAFAPVRGKKGEAEVFAF
jgi:hypothetical protein